MPLCGVYDVSVCRRRYSAWLNVLNINLQSFSFSQYDSGWVGFGSALAGAIGGVLSWLVNTAASAVVGLAVGGVIVAIVARLPDHDALITGDDLSDVFARHGENLRDALGDLYDRYELRSRRSRRS